MGQKIAAGFCLAFSVIGLVGGAVAATIAPQDVAIDDLEVTTSLTGTVGDPTKGGKWFKSRKLGNCLACHGNKDQVSEPFHGEIGPPLDGVADRYSEAQLRAIVVDAKAVFGPETIMPGFYRVIEGKRVLKEFQGKTILTAEQVEDVIAYLMTLKE